MKFIPHDIPLALPANEIFLDILLVVSFVAHISFVYLMVGGSLLSFYYEWKGLKDSDFREFAKYIGKTITVNKSLAVVLGVAPLLIINVLYTVWFYAANALTGTFWLMVIPLVAIVFLLTYFHKYTWDFFADSPKLHLALNAVICLIFLFVPLIFLTNINLMLFPNKWEMIQGFASALTLPSVFQRYAYFILSCVGLSSLCLLWVLANNKCFVPDLSKDGQLRILKELRGKAVFAMAMMIPVGALVLYILPSEGMSLKVFVFALVAALILIGLVSTLVKQMKSGADFQSLKTFRMVVFFVCSVLSMATARHFYREQALAEPKKMVALKTKDYQEKVAAALASKDEVVESDIATNPGKELFASCAGCHGYGSRLVGPPVTEIQKIYAGNPEGIVKWALAPGKKRADYPPMPAMPLPAEDLKKIADYMLEMKE